MGTEQQFTGIVTQSTGLIYYVRREGDGQSVECRIRGKLRLKGARSTNPVVVGDTVDCECDERGEYAISNIHPRTNYIIRRSPNLSKESHIIAANIDQAAIVVTLFSPTTNIEFIDRFLVTCEAYKVPATILLNKSDLLIGEAAGAAEEFCNIYSLAGYHVLKVSATEGSNIDSLRQFLKGKTTLLSGNSGVGKSTIIQAVEPGTELRTGAISDYHHKGRHTTTFSKMYSLSLGGDVIDSPGIKGFGLLDIEPQELSHYFPDLMRYAPACQFYNCTHQHEPGCGVQQAVMEGYIAPSRYESYLKILEEDEKYRK